MLKNFGLVMTCLSALTACTTGMNISQQPVYVTPKFPDKAQGLDVYGVARQNGDPAPEYLGERLVTLRTVFANSGPGSTEFSGARCKIESSAFTADVTSPVQIVVPDYGSNSPVITAQCRTNDRQATNSVSVFNASQRRRDQANDPFLFGGIGLLGNRHSGLSVGVSINLSNRSKDIYEYPTLRVKFE